MKVIYLGENDQKMIIEDYVKSHNISRVFIVGDPVDLDPSIRVDHITYGQSIEYKYYYPWLKDISADCLVVWNKAMRTTKRSDLHYNCIRRYMQQADHRILFEYFPLKENEEDFMILWDMTKNNPHLKEPYAECDFKGEEGEIVIGKIKFTVHETNVEFSSKDLADYEAEKERLIGEVSKDPNIVPRRLLKWTEARASKIAGGKFDTKKDIKPEMHVTVTQTGVDKYYMDRLNKFKESIKNVCKKIQS